ncbi:hypothetical protein AKN94_01060 [Thiopseudomonas alkaliphila]|uniref:hypothetical protein n=1 Tax=Thiopseudomonas alkaliphila TaxID=1697053 RepID=UPI00069EE3F2|nr:hypothetical protein [Thiopseudomonas alkaliphila]AKX46114.1 hypothetical protein AKN94_01060 [Thiopseudomonas alkaliphila]
MSACKNRVEININLSCDHSEKREEKYNNVQNKPNILFGYLLSCFIGIVLTFGSEVRLEDLAELTKGTYIIFGVLFVAFLWITFFKKNIGFFIYIYGECLQVLCLNLSLFCFLLIKKTLTSNLLCAALSFIFLALLYWGLFYYENYGAKSSGKSKA